MPEITETEFKALLKEVAVVEKHWAGHWHGGTSRIFLLDRDGNILDSYIGGQNVQWRLAAVGDVNSDGYDELVLQYHPAGIRIFDRNLDPLIQAPDYQDVIALNDINGDGQIEIIASSSVGHELAILGPDLQPLWRDATFNGHPHAILSDLTGNGANEIIVHTATELRIYAHQKEPLPTVTSADSRHGSVVFSAPLGTIAVDGKTFRPRSGFISEYNDDNRYRKTTKKSREKNFAKVTLRKRLFLIHPDPIADRLP